jgi:mannose/fructose/N-acetylgalactosamine-specific phosphotransferase system component IIC
LTGPGLWWGLAAAALINLDRQACGQLGLARPLASATLCGWLAGQPLVGLTLGFWTELIWLNRPPLGGEIPPNGGLAASAATLGLAAALPANADPALAMAAATLALVVIPPLARLAALIEVIARRLAAVRALDVERSILSGGSPSALKAQLAGVATTLGLTTLALVLALFLVQGLTALALVRLPGPVWATLTRAAPLAPVAALACAADTIGRQLTTILAMGLVLAGLYWRGPLL